MIDFKKARKSSEYIYIVKAVEPEASGSGFSAWA